MSYTQEVSDPVKGFVKMKVSYGSCQIVKTSEDGKVDGISFTISGNGVNKTVKTANGGKIQIDNLMPGIYTVTEQTIDKYVPQEVHRVTVVAGQVAKVNFNNVLKRGTLKVIKSSEDNLVEGVTFHLYGTSLSGIAVDEYAVTDNKGVATFKDVLISGSKPYTIEEVDTAIRYVVPANQTAPINWNEVTTRNFTNILKKFSVTVTKSDQEEGTPQGDAKLSGAVYGIYKGETLVDKYVTDKDGQFTTKEYVCDSDWTVREITPSEGYLLDTTIHKIGAEPKLFTIEHNLVTNDVTEQVIKGNIAIIKHTDNGDTQIETPESGAAFEIYLKSSGSYEAAEDDEKDIIVCDENGFGQTKDMPYGIYTVHQTSGWEGRELMSDFDVFISQNGQTYRYLINNANFESYYPYGRAFTAGGNQAIVEVVLTQVGNQRGQPYWSWYGFDSRVEWCACFVSWCADQCGYIESGFVPKFADCVDGANWFKSNGKWQDRTYEPKAGDIIFFDWEGDGTTDHVGIVEKCENGTVYTVEGNSHDACKQNQYAVGSSSICGYGIPQY